MPRWLVSYLGLFSDARSFDRSFASFASWSRLIPPVAPHPPFSKLVSPFQICFAQEQQQELVCFFVCSLHVAHFGAFAGDLPDLGVPKGYDISNSIPNHSEQRCEWQWRGCSLHCPDPESQQDRPYQVDAGLCPDRLSTTTILRIISEQVEASLPCQSGVRIGLDRWCADANHHLYAVDGMETPN